MSRYFFLAQRLSAMLIAPLVLVHLGLILYAIHGGLSADEILGRTQGSLGWGLFYGVFVLAASIHAPLGVRNILTEWTSLSQCTVRWFCVALALLLLATGLRAVVAVTKNNASNFSSSRDNCSIRTHGDANQCDFSYVDFSA